MKRASSSLETVVGILIIVMALFAMSAYVKGGIAGKWKSATEGALGPQYDPDETSFVNEYVKAGSSESVTRMEKRSKIINVTVGDKEYKHKADVWYQVSYQNAGSQGLVDDQGNEVFAQDLDRHSMKEITTKTYNVDVGDTLLHASAKTGGSTTNNDDKKVIDNKTKIDDKKVDDQNGKTKGGDDTGDTKIDVVIPDDQYNLCGDLKLAVGKAMGTLPDFENHGYTHVRPSGGPKGQSCSRIKSSTESEFITSFNTYCSDAIITTCGQDLVQAVVRNSRNLKELVVDFQYYGTDSNRKIGAWCTRYSDPCKVE